ncbi:MAG TPA: hypothetical protein VM717_06925 [Chthoniobacterales bacterium]|jgi:hypothetical protein|nr:hypothetical protein [Chthoniobacterales bacterium]
MTPASKKEKPAAEKIAKTDSVSPPAEHLVRGPDSYHKKVAAKPPGVAEEQNEPLSTEEELKRTEPATTMSPMRTFLEPPSIRETPPVPHETVTEPKPEVTEQKSELPSQSPEVSQDPSSEPPPATDSPSVSVNALVGPPSSLRAIPENSPPENKEPESTPKREGPLTESEAINLADNKARLQGFQLDNYERPKIDHSAVKRKWTLF